MTMMRRLEGPYNMYILLCKYGMVWYGMVWYVWYCTEENWEWVVVTAIIASAPQRSPKKRAVQTRALSFYSGPQSQKSRLDFINDGVYHT